jgi:tRNA pseudouridine55 synthase
MSSAINPLSGLVVVEKPTGWTSRDVVNKITFQVGRKTPVGHAGTLDPLAMGVLVVCLGQATRLVEYIQCMTKTYEAVIRLGCDSDTDDVEGQVRAREIAEHPTEKRIVAALAEQTGSIEQVPPRFSAIHVKGKRAYQLARAQKVVELAPRTVQVYRIELKRFAWPELELIVECGSGTYIRSIARDLGSVLQCGGVLQTLVRTRIGPFERAEALDPRASTREAIAANVRPPLDAVKALEWLQLDKGQSRRILSGQSVAVEGRSQSIGEELVLLTPDGQLLAIATVQNGTIQPRKVFTNA